MRSTRISVVGLAIAAAVVLGGCATAPPQKESTRDRGCIKRSEINAITPLDDEHVFIKLSATRYQLFTVEKPCNGLRLARVVSIADAAARVCGGGTAVISFDYPAAGPTRCRISRSEPVANKAAALDLIESRASDE